MRWLLLGVLLMANTADAQPYQPDGPFANPCVTSTVARTVNGVRVLAGTPGRVVGPGTGGAAYVYSVQWAKGFDNQGIVVSPVFDPAVNVMQLTYADTCQPYVDHAP